MTIELEVVQDTEPLTWRSTTHDVNLGLKCLNRTHTHS